MVDSIAAGVMEHLPLLGFYFCALWGLHVVAGTVSASKVPSIYAFQPSDDTIKKLAKKMKMKDPDQDQKDKLWEKHIYMERVNWNMTIVSMLSSAYMFVFYAIAVNQVFVLGTKEDRWAKVTPAAVHGVCMHLATSLYETTTYILTDKTFEFYAHHVVVLACCGSMLFTGRATAYCAWLGLVEGTNVPLCSLTLLGKVAKGSSAYVASGALLWVSYVILRVVSCPVAMYMMYNDRFVLDPDRTWSYVLTGAQEDLAWFIGVHSGGTFLWLLSMYWFYLITKGLLKAIGVGVKTKGE